MSSERPIALAYLLDPLVHRLERVGVNRSVATLGLILLFFLAIVSSRHSKCPIGGA